MSLSGDLQLITDRLLLRTLNSTNAKEVCKYLVSNRTFLEPWETRRDPQYFTVDEQAKLLDTQNKANKEGSGLSLWIFLKHSSDAKDIQYGQVPIGNINFSNIIRGPFLSCFLGYKLDRQHLSRGYATEAIHRGMGYVFDILKLHRVEANVMPRNTASRRVLEKLGFESEGLAPRYLKINGKWEDHIHYSIRNEALEKEGTTQV